MNTFPIVVCATPAVLTAEAQSAGLSIENYRLGTLKRADVEIANLLDDETLDLHWREIFLHLSRQVRIAIGDNSKFYDIEVLPPK